LSTEIAAHSAGLTIVVVFLCGSPGFDGSIASAVTKSPSPFAADETAA
jgi:hypothetical protein